MAGSLRDRLFVARTVWSHRLWLLRCRLWPPPELKGRRRFLDLIGVLHSHGYERLRLDAHMSPSGIHWRGAVTVAGHSERVGPFSSAAGFEILFEWKDAQELTLDQLADRFVERHPSVAQLARGTDSAYVRWYAEMLTVTAPLGAVYFDAPTGDVCVIGPGARYLSRVVPRPPAAQSVPEAS